jgi:nucleotide-binding universal stress UspA family protein
VNLSEEKPSAFLFRGDKILVPMANPKTQPSLLKLAECLSDAEESEIVVLSVVVARNGQKPREALIRQSQIGDAVHVLNGATRAAEESSVTFTPLVRAARSLAEGIAHAAEEERAKLVVMGWSATEDAEPSDLVEDVARKCRSNLAFFHMKSTSDRPSLKYRRIGVALGGSANIPLMVQMANALTFQEDGIVTYFSVLDPYCEKSELDHVRQIQIEAISRHEGFVSFRTEVLRSDNPLQAIVDKTRDLDLLIVGTGPIKGLNSEGIGSFAAMIVDRSNCSVIIVRREKKFTSIIPPPPALR